MSGFNLSEWAIRHRPLVTYCMIAIVIGGIGAYLRLGRSEDPNFTIKTMVVQAAWPGATLADTIEQVTDRLERKLQETPGVDHLNSFTTPGNATIFVHLKDSTSPREVPDIWYQVRKKISDIRGTLPQGLVGPGFNDEFGDTYGILYGFTADGFTHRELRDYVDDARNRLLQVPDIAKVDLLGIQDERVQVEFSTAQLAGLGIDRSTLIAALQAQNSVTPAGVVQTDSERILVRVSGAFRTEQDVLAVNFAVNNRIIRLGDIAHVTRGPADPPQPMFRINGRDGIGLAIAMRKGGDVLALGHNIKLAMTEITAGLPIGIEAKLIADQPVTVEHAVDDFMEALWEAIAIVLAVSLVSLGLRAGAVVALAIPLVLAVVSRSPRCSPWSSCRRSMWPGSASVSRTLRPGTATPCRPRRRRSDHHGHGTPPGAGGPVRLGHRWLHHILCDLAWRACPTAGSAAASRQEPARGAVPRVHRGGICPLHRCAHTRHT